MKNNSIKYLLLLCGILVLGGSCKKYIYQTPITSTYGEKFWTSKTSVEQASNSMYIQLRSSFRASRSFFINGDLVSGFYVPASNQWNYATLKASNNPAYNFSYVPYLPELQDWSRFYRIIAQANIILKNVPAMPAGTFPSEQVRNGYMAEALFMRAFVYFYMIRVWGDPVYVTKVYDDVDYGKIPPVARTAEGAVIDSCLADLKTASGYLSFSNDRSKVTRAGKGAILALMAHMYAWKHDYNNAHLACQEIIDKGGYELEPIESYKNIWKGEASNENIWELSMKATQNSTSETDYDFFATFLKGSLVDGRSNNCWVSPNNGFVDQFYDGSDLRLSRVFTKVNAGNGDPAGYLLTKYGNFQYAAPDTKSDPYLDNNLVLFRLSDIYLLNAEALAFQNDLSGAKANLAKTEDRAGIASYEALSSQYDIVDEVVMERARELTGEGTWFYDLIRTNKTQGWLEYVGYPAGERLDDNNKGYYWPLNMGTLFPQDNLLTQNPWWAKNR
ncbi:RagB/SusD family nutrient uptake outer membrane protein [Niabella drilacis]|uniref:Starch-binding associating with outer membrane n=1 Tax=Niabella drilacis (strain DSM 25811 / CCM 8410 / CCUG 62505 / LMG 26954 / E90) TaxID=1285928 RepID=A0A1G6LSQ3_NIADE|nr:RagB/SusD family nutrient uptake outer membrane protein [Niabella drilacis]SDC46292.1 Starch-binding associating with outer membrane [Niabella drilacis]